MPATAPFYNFVGTLGGSPAVVTEAIWSLAVNNDPPMFPTTVHLVTTTMGRQGWHNQMESDGQEWTFGGKERTGRVWETFSDEILQGRQPEVEIYVPSYSSGQLLGDIQNENDDRVAANRIWEVVYELTQPGKQPLVASLAGGRKTMSAHLQSAMEGLGRPADRLLHLIVRDELVHASPPFYYPDPDNPNPGLWRVPVTFQSQRRYHERTLFKKIDDPSDREAFMAAAERHEFVEPERLRVWANHPPREPIQMEFLDEEDVVIDSCQLTPWTFATLLVLAEHVGRGASETAAKTDLLSAFVERQRKVALWCCYEDPLKGWFRKDEQNHDDDGHVLKKVKNRLVKAVTGLNKQNEDLPIARRYLSFESKDQDRYRWQNALEPPLQVVLDEQRQADFEGKNERPPDVDGPLFEHVEFISARTLR